MSSTSFKDVGTAAKFKSIMQSMITDVINKIRPLPRYGIVTQIDYVNNKCLVLFTGEANSTKVNLGAVAPSGVGQQVRVEGDAGNLYVADTYDTPNQDGVIVSGANYIEMAASSQNHTSTGNWQDVTWGSVVEDYHGVDGPLCVAGSAIFNILVTGTYKGFSIGTFASNTTGSRGLRWADSTGKIYHDDAKVSNQPNGSRVSSQFSRYLLAGTQMKVQWYQNSGGNLAGVDNADANPFYASLELQQRLY